MSVPAVTVFLAAARGDAPAGSGWLTPWERRREAALRSEPRRRNWRLGRWVAKRAVAACLAARLTARGQVRATEPIEVRSEADGAPRVWLPGRSDGRPPPVLSLSHRAGRGFAAAAEGPLALGCDVERIEPRSRAFVRDYLTPAERARVESAEPGVADLMANLLWSAKESALKALRVGLTVDTRTVDVRVGPGLDDLAGARVLARGLRTDGWAPLGASVASGARLRGWWRAGDGCVWTLVADRPLELPATMAWLRVDAAAAAEAIGAPEPRA
jgi:4'-phosphopantetheinyl transferase